MNGKLFMLGLAYVSILFISCKDESTSKEEARPGDTDPAEKDTGEDTGTGEEEEPATGEEDTGTGEDTEPVVDPCSGVLCNQPPDNSCDNTSELSIYNAIGWCSSAGCMYASLSERCPAGDCASGICTTEPCHGARCFDPPANECVDNDTLKIYNSVGYCGVLGGAPACLYGTQEIDCEDGCEDSRCVEEHPCERIRCKDEPARYCDAAGDLAVWDTLPKCHDGECLYGMQNVSCTADCEDGSCVGENPCANVHCYSPPSSYCLNDTTLRTYSPVGTCDSGACSYEPNDLKCASGCEDGRCMDDPCNGVSCSDIPPAYCSDENTLLAWDGSMGTCNEGVCEYAMSEYACTDGCLNGRCEGEPCLGVICARPSADYCLDDETAVVHGASGSCTSEGVCVYPSQDEPCDNGCALGKCNLAGEDTDTIDTDSAMTDSDTSTETIMDTDSDTATDTNTETDTSTETATMMDSADSESSTDGDTDADTDTDVDTDADSETNTDTFGNTTGTDSSNVDTDSVTVMSGMICAYSGAEPHVCACDDGQDNDDDSFTDAHDLTCYGPYDDDEGSFATGIPGDANGTAGDLECPWDGNSGIGNDGVCCNPVDPSTNPTPNGCDDQACCEIDVNHNGSGEFVYVLGECTYTPTCGEDGMHGCPCETEQECDVGQFCVPDGNTGDSFCSLCEPCSSNDICANPCDCGEVCFGGFVRPDSDCQSGGTCASELTECPGGDTDCDTDRMESCIDGCCYPRCEDGVEPCVTSSDCGSGYACIAGCCISFAV